MSGVNLLSASAVTPQVVASGYIGTSEGAVSSVFPVAAATSLKITQASICNVTGSAVTVSLSLVKSGDTAGTANRFIHSYSIAGNDTLPLDSYLVGAMLGVGDSISGIAGTGSAVVFTASGTVHT